MNTNKNYFIVFWVTLIYQQINLRDPLHVYKLKTKKNNWVIFCRPVTLNLLPTIHCKVKNPPKITGLCPYYADHWRSRTVPKHFHMLQKNSPLHRHIAVSINTKHIWVTISCFSALYFRVPFDGSNVSSQPVFQYIPVYRWQSTTDISIVSI